MSDEEKPKLCKDCRFAMKPSFFDRICGLGWKYAKCRRATEKESDIDVFNRLVDGESPAKRYSYATLARMFFCGKEAKYFQSRNKVS